MNIIFYLIVPLTYFMTEKKRISFDGTYTISLLSDQAMKYCSNVWGFLIES